MGLEDLLTVLAVAFGSAGFSEGCQCCMHARLLMPKYLLDTRINMF